MQQSSPPYHTSVISYEWENFYITWYRRYDKDVEDLRIAIIPCFEFRIFYSSTPAALYSSRNFILSDYLPFAVRVEYVDTCLFQGHLRQVEHK